MTSLVVHRKDRRAKGLCGEFGCEVVTGDQAFRCPDHAKAHNAAKKAWYWRRKEKRAREKAA